MARATEDDKQIEITPEMISAGIRDLALWNASEDDCALIVESVYRAMYEAKRMNDHTRMPERPELNSLLEKARRSGVTDEQMREQCVSFAYGNAPESAGITKESVRNAAKSIRMAR